MAERRGQSARKGARGRPRSRRHGSLPGLEPLVVRPPVAGEREELEAVSPVRERAAALPATDTGAGEVPRRTARQPRTADPNAQEFVCPSCDSADFRVLFNARDRLCRATETSFRLVECAHCRLIRLYPRPAVTDLHRFYPDQYWYAPEAAADKLEETYGRLVLCDHVAFVRRALQESGASGPVVDVGCGAGLFLRMLKQEGADVLGIDFSRNAASVAWRHNGVPAVCGELENAPLPPHSCAAITMFQVLEHLPCPDRYLHAARSLLRPDGRLIVQVPNAACWQFLLLGENWSGLDVPRHLVNFRPKDLDHLLDCCGFEVLRHRYFSLRDNPAGLATSLVPALDPVLRKLRGIEETPRARVCRDLLYFGLVAAALPFTLLEAACRAGSTIMVEARKKK